MAETVNISKEASFLIIHFKKIHEYNVASTLLRGTGCFRTSGGCNTVIEADFSTGIVRYLTPLEYERLFGFPDNWTAVPYKGYKPENTPDYPRYQALGNSMCVNVMRWIGLGIQTVEDIMNGGIP